MIHNSKFIFFGTPEFAAIILGKLIEVGYIPSAVICNPDRPVGRKRIITPPPVKSLIMKHRTWNIEVLQPENLRDLKFENCLPAEASAQAGKLSAEGGSASGGEIGEIDFAIVAAYAHIIPKEILDIPRLGTIGVHPSLLPKYRGATPIQSAILDGETKTGTTLYVMDEKVDHGSIVASTEYRVASNDSYETLQKKLAELSADLLIETLPKFIEGKITPKPQDESEATYTKKFKTEDGFVDLEKDSPALILRKVKALNPEPGVWFTKDGKRTKILEAELNQNGNLVLKKIQIEGQKPKSV